MGRRIECSSQKRKRIITSPSIQTAPYPIHLNIPTFESMRILVVSLFLLVLFSKNGYTQYNSLVIQPVDTSDIELDTTTSNKSISLRNAMMDPDFKMDYYPTMNPSAKSTMSEQDIKQVNNGASKNTHLNSKGKQSKFNNQYYTPPKNQPSIDYNSIKTNSYSPSFPK